MDFIERLFHIAPDGGNGMLEGALLAAALLVSLAVTAARTSRRART